VAVVNGEPMTVGTADLHITVTPHRSGETLRGTQDPPWVCFASRNGDDVAGLVLEVHECEQLIRAIRDAVAWLDEEATS
jgi:hypothetical protein